MSSFRRFTSLFVLGLGILGAACSSAGDDGDDPANGEDALSTRNMTANDFGLKDHEIALTLDDGPGPRTIELAQWLADNDVPATFFMVGKNAKVNPAAVAKVAEISNAHNGLFIIGNHSMTHTTPLPSQGLQGSIHEIADADAILHDAIAKAQSVGYPSPVYFFRPPYGAFTALGAANIAKVNENTSAGRYTGPVFWDIGGELSANYSADWACWGKVTMDRCIDGYIAEATARKRGLMLAHDVHAKTVDMLMGKGAANGRSLIKELRAKGFKFVGLRSHDSAVANFGQQQEQLSSNAEITIDANVSTQNGGRVVVDIRTAGDAKIVVAFDSQAPTAEFHGNKQIDVTLAPGSHFVTVSAIGRDGTMHKQERYTFIIASDIANHDGQTDDHAPCVNYDHLTLHRPFKMFIKKVACDAPGAHVAVPGECYAYDGTVRVAANAEGQAAVRATGGAEWSVEYDLTFAADPNDLSKLSLILEQGTGHIVTGKRHAFRNAHGQAVNRAEAPFTETSVDCNEGIWRGQFEYSTGSKEDFLFRKPNADEPEYNER